MNIDIDIILQHAGSDSDGIRFVEAHLLPHVVADPGGNPAMPPNPAMAPMQSDSLAINFEFDIRAREVRPSIKCFFCLSSIDSQEN